MYQRVMQKVTNVDEIQIDNKVTTDQNSRTENFTRKEAYLQNDYLPDDYPLNESPRASPWLMPLGVLGGLAIAYRLRRYIRRFIQKTWNQMKEY